ncbi:type II toxin-antitoxin system VapC family toxin [Actomonas aquatica]|uniref:Type II toxin-antitoxin system VapC family toxin n=1 Tax=Actomonas aquatica TaxID=2866162 RepID=A0ABZ1C6C0_9BACT|nr:type II toxin-antitoxin system VapC family toxin [Opitutus sp. WL0086]WRQ86872.1 type II toxin-antitoxin system VapC family toxin [Opitutus sp. WL0086]
MRLLLDSHVLIWWLEDPRQLSPELRPLLQDPGNTAYFSPASIWELGLKVAKGKLRIPSDFTAILVDDGFDELPVTAAHATHTLSLPPLHSDPFDRLLIAQALCEGLVLATRDAWIPRYDVPTIQA